MQNNENFTRQPSKLHREIERMYRHKRMLIASLAIIVVLMVYLFKDATTPLRSMTFIGFLLFFYLVDHLLDVRFEFKHYCFIIIIGISSIMLSHLYFVYSQYDKTLHFVMPMLICSIMFYMTNKLQLKVKWKIIFAVLATIATLSLFEIGEYLLDSLFGLKLQGVFLRDFKGFEKFNIILNPLDDTMVDLSFGIVGSLVYTAYAFLKYYSRGKRE